MKNSKGYFDIDIDVEKALCNYGSDEIFYIQDLKQRKLYLNSDIEQCTIADVTRHILQYNAEDKGIPVGDRKPIFLYVVSNGGEVDSGFELIDAIMLSKTPVYTVNLGYQYSMGFLIGIAGHWRYATPNAKFLMHDGSSFVYNSTSKARDQLQFNEQVEERTKQYILDHSKLTSEEYDKKMRVEWYMYADEAKERGFIDFIIGQDCDLDEVV